MSITFYEAPMSSATPVSWALAELQVPHERVRFDLSSGAQRKPEFLRLNPNGKVPTLVVEGTPLFEALAIMMWLGDRFGAARKLWPAALDAPARGEAMAWSAWAYVSYGSAVGRYFLAQGQRGSEFVHPGQAAYARSELEALQAILAGRLERAPYLLGEEFSLVDLINASVVGYGVFVGVSVAGQPRVQDWLERCQARPANRALMAG